MQYTHSLIISVSSTISETDRTEFPLVCKTDVYIINIMFLTTIHINPLKASVLCIGHVVVLELWAELNVCVQLSSRCLHGMIQLSVLLTNNRFYLHMKVAIAHVCGAKS